MTYIQETSQSKLLCMLRSKVFLDLPFRVRSNEIQRIYLSSLPIFLCSSSLPFIHRRAAFSSLSYISDHPNSRADFKLEEVFNVKGKVALVTGTTSTLNCFAFQKLINLVGGGSGIGLMVTQALAVNGAKVYIVGRTEDKLDRVAKTYGKDMSGQIIPIVADVSNKVGIVKLVAQVEDREKHLHVLINNAGISEKTFQTEASTSLGMKNNLFDHGEAKFEYWLNEYRTNVAGAYFMTMAFLPLLQRAAEQDHGYSSAVINISSVSGMVKTAQHYFSYNPNKAAAIHLTRMMANEIVANVLKIRVNSINTFA